MKKQLSHIITAAIVLFSMGNISAQDNPAFDNGFSLRFGLNLPSSSFGTFDFENNTGNGTIKYNGSSIGYGLELGSMYFLNAIDIGESFRIGIDATYLDLNFINANYTYTPAGIGETPQDATLGFFQMGCMVGPFFSFSPIDNLSLDLAFKFNPAWSVFGSNNENVADFGLNLFSLNYVPALYFRYSILFIGLEYNIANHKHQIGNTATSTISDASIATNMTRAKFLIGFKF